MQNREWLNKDAGFAAVQWNVDDHEANFEVADCYRKATLDFSLYSKEQCRAAEYKIRVLKRELLAFEKALKKAIRIRDKQNAKD